MNQGNFSYYFSEQTYLKSRDFILFQISLATLVDCGITSPPTTGMTACPLSGLNSRSALQPSLIGTPTTSQLISTWKILGKTFCRQQAGGRDLWTSGESEPFDGKAKLSPTKEKMRVPQVLVAIWALSGTLSRNPSGVFWTNSTLCVVCTTTLTTKHISSTSNSWSSRECWSPNLHLKWVTYKLSESKWK